MYEVAHVRGVYGGRRVRVWSPSDEGQRSAALRWRERWPVFLDEDLFTSHISFETREAALTVIRQRWQHTFFSSVFVDRSTPRYLRTLYEAGGVPENLWIGAEVYSQERTEAACAMLGTTLPARRFLLVMPREPITLSPGVDWVIVSAPITRAMDLKWVLGIVEQAESLKIPCLVGDLGGWAYEVLDVPQRPGFYSLAYGKHQATGAFVEAGDTRRRWLQFRSKYGDDPDEWPEALRSRQWPQGFDILSAGSV